MQRSVSISVRQRQPSGQRVCVSKLSWAMRMLEVAAASLGTGSAPRVGQCWHSACRCQACCLRRWARGIAVHHTQVVKQSTRTEPSAHLGNHRLRPSEHRQQETTRLQHRHSAPTRTQRAAELQLSGRWYGSAPRDARPQRWMMAHGSLELDGQRHQWRMVPMDGVWSHPWQRRSQVPLGGRRNRHGLRQPLINNLINLIQT